MREKEKLTLDERAQLYCMMHDKGKKETFLDGYSVGYEDFKEELKAQLLVLEEENIIAKILIKKMLYEYTHLCLITKETQKNTKQFLKNSEVENDCRKGSRKH